MRARTMCSACDPKRVRCAVRVMRSACNLQCVMCMAYDAAAAALYVGLDDGAIRVFNYNEDVQAEPKRRFVVRAACHELVRSQHAAQVAWPDTAKLSVRSERARWQCSRRAAHAQAPDVPL
jgi:hypothetical protein